LSFKPLRHSIDQSKSLGRKIIGWKTRTISESIYADELVINLTMKICYEATNTDPNIIYILIKICLERYNKYELFAYTDTDCFACSEKITIFRIYVKKAKSSLQLRIVDNSIMSHNETIEELNIEIEGIQCVIPVLWATNLMEIHP